MKLHVIAIAASLLFPVALRAADHDHHDHAAAKAPAAWVDGTVKKIDPAKGTVTLSHGPITNLDMPGMTMSFPVKASASLAGIKEGDKVRFQAEMAGSQTVVVRIEAAK